MLVKGAREQEPTTAFIFVVHVTIDIFPPFFIPLDTTANISMEYSLFFVPLRTELVFSVTRELMSIPASSLSSPLFTPPNLESLLSRYVDQQSLEYLHDKLQ